MKSIPPITDPLGKHWDQPPVADIALDDSCAMMSTGTFDELVEYSCSIPTGKYPGKMWKASMRGKWFLRWYEADPNDATMLLIPWVPIVVVD